MDFKKRLIFHFYAEQDYSTNRAVLIHLACLKKYSYLFDEALFCICVDNVKETNLIMDLEKRICECGFKDVRFKVVQNSAYREARTFYDEIATKLNSLDGMTFFGHTKGYTNYKTLANSATVDSLDTWITGLYYLSLNSIEEVENSLFSNLYYNKFYGSFLTYCDYSEFSGLETKKNFIYYSGTFFWINALNLAMENNKPIPLLNWLNYAELFVSFFYTYEDCINKTCDCVGSPNNYMSFWINLYACANEIIKPYLGVNLQNFLEYKKNIIENI